MRRAILLILDSVGIGSAPDASAYGDEGADTIGHIAEFCARRQADREGVRAGPLALPNLVQLAQLAQFGGSFCDFMLSGVSRIKQLAGVRS
jgi:phosphopentomutase